MKVRLSIKKDYFYSYRIRITPTLILVTSPALDQTNRVLREFIQTDQGDGMIRVRFTNENGDPYHYKDKRNILED
jgi:hypothetical protein